jgi:2-phospho-L-lactate transferase/gluconeogenesis factor (CofD/UPF0052 family)
MLANGKVITGQSQISHPPEEQPNNPNLMSNPSVNYYETSRDGLAEGVSSFYSISQFNQTHEDIPYQHPDLLISQLKFNKNATSPLEAPISRIFYINPYGEEIHPKANSRTIMSLNNSSDIVYSIGSLMTSIVPVLILQGIGYSIKHSKANKILLLNGNSDRETYGFTALDFINTIYSSIHYSFGTEFENVKLSYTEVVTHLIYLENSEIAVDTTEIEKLGIRCIKIKKDSKLNESINLYDLDELQHTLSQWIGT